MPEFYRTKTWRAQIPDAWRVADEGGEELVTIFRPDGVGMLRVLSAEERSSDATLAGEDFRGTLSGRTWAHTYGPSYSRTWVLSCRGRKLFVRYSCAAHNAEAELPEVYEIVQSITENNDDVA